MLSIIIPRYQEKVNSAEIGRIFADLGFEAQIIISNDFLHRGKGWAIKKGMGQAKYSHVLFMDADLQVPCDEIKAFFKIMDVYNADVVVGNKRHPYSCVRYTMGRKIISWGYRVLVGMLFRLNIKDTQCGFKLFKKEVLDLVIEKVRTDRYAFDLELLISIKESGFRIVDAPVYVKRQINRGSISWHAIWSTFRDTIKIWIWKNRKWYSQ